MLVVGKRFRNFNNRSLLKKAFQEHAAWTRRTQKTLQLVEALLEDYITLLFVLCLENISCRVSLASKAWDYKYPLHTSMEGVKLTFVKYSFLFEVEPDHGGLLGIVISDNSNDPLLEPPEFESFHFDLYDDPSFPRPPPEPPDIENSLIVETDAPVINNVDEIDIEDDDSFTFVIWTFFLFLTYPKDSPKFSKDSRDLSRSTRAS
ncbi:hypothetical protein Tco_0077862 [Tanacetum coccineum]